MLLSNVMYHSDGSFVYDDRYYASFAEATSRLKDGYVVCERLQDDRPGRLRLHKLFAPSENVRKKGWYDLFTYTPNSTAPLAEGFYFCKISELKGDKKGYVNLVVDIISYLGKDIREVPNSYLLSTILAIFGADEKYDKPIWEFIRPWLSPIAFYPCQGYISDLNNAEAVSKGFTQEAVLAAICKGDTSIIDAVSLALLEPSAVKKSMEYIKRHQYDPEFREWYPLLQKKVEAKAVSENFLERKLNEFEEKKLCSKPPKGATSEQILLCKVEAALKYWHDKNHADKAAKKAARKAAKSAV